MTERIDALKQHIQDLNDAGVRKTLLYGLVSKGLAGNEGKPIQVRRAEAFAYVLDRAPQVVLPHELICGSMLGMVPLYEHPLTKQEQVDKAVATIDAYLASKQAGTAGDGSINFGEGHAKSFEEDFTSKKSRWSLMSRVHHDALVEYKELQDLIALMDERYADADIEHYEIGRELERAFKISYPAEEKAPYDQLPWFIGNHLNLNYGRMARTGLQATHDDVARRLTQTNDQESQEYLTACLVCIEAVQRFIHRYAHTLHELVTTEGDRVRAAELERMAEICEHVADEPARTFYEALQLTWMLHAIASIQGGSALSFGRLDQYLYPFYKADIEAGRIDADFAKELLACVWLKVNEPKMRTVQSLTVGGVDRNGNDATNELTRLCLQVAADVAMPYPNLGLRIHDGGPSWVYDEALHTIRSGSGQPMLLNDDIWVQSLLKLGYALEDARDYYNMGCVEIMVAGKQPSWGVLDAVAFPVLIEDVLRRHVSGERTIETFEQFMDVYFEAMDAAVEADYQEALGKKRNLKDQCYDCYSSLLIDGCIENAHDMLQDGSELPIHWSVYGYGIGTASDSLRAVKHYVFDEQRMTLSELADALADNFEHYRALREELLDEEEVYGNDKDEVDEIANRVLDHFATSVLALNDRSDEMGRDRFVSTLFGYFFHIYHGEIANATPDGRLRGEPFSDSMGPGQGRDTNGPTRLLNSVLHLDCSNVTGGYALNFKVNPVFLQDEKGRESLKTVLRTYMASGGPQIQNYTSKIEDMQDAMVHPEKHRDLIVRVGGYCEFFVNLDRSLQVEIMNRTFYGQ